MLDGTGDRIKASIYDKMFSLEDMRQKNRASIYLDGIENISDGVLVYTDELLRKVKTAFGVNLMKKVSFDNIETAVDLIIREIIEKNI